MIKSLQNLSIFVSNDFFTKKLVLVRSASQNVLKQDLRSPRPCYIDLEIRWFWWCLNIQILNDL